VYKSDAGKEFDSEAFSFTLAVLARAPESSKLDKIDAQNRASKKEQVFQSRIKPILCA